MDEFFAGAPFVIAHRGASAHAPENTEVAFRLAREVGAEGFEADVRATRDGVPVAFHDARVDRCTDGRGSVRRFRYAELARLDAGYRWSPDGGRSFPYRGRGLRILTAMELLRAFPDARIVLHVKSAAAARALARHIDPREVRGRVLAASEWSWRLAPLHGRGWLLGATTEEVAAFLAASALGRRPQAPRPLLLPPRRGPIPVLRASVVRRAHEAGQRVIAWVVNDPNFMRTVLHWGVDAVETDDPERAVAVLRDWRAARAAPAGVP
jgi:glycerophosphoryl diester phosphodiesterase